MGNIKVEELKKWDRRLQKPPEPKKRETLKAKRFYRWKQKRLGTFGPASPVRRIDPVTGQVIGPVPKAEAHGRSSPKK